MSFLQDSSFDSGIEWNLGIFFEEGDFRGVAIGWLLAVIYLIIVYDLSAITNLLENQRAESTTSMRYTILDPNNGAVLRRADRKFDCGHLKLLENYRLSDKYKIDNDKKVVQFSPSRFVIAANSEYFPYARTIISNIQNTFDKVPRIIFYDLGGISGHIQKETEVRSVCNLDYRVFNFSMIPENVRKLKIFAWKVMILAEMFNEFGSFTYADTSVHFLQPAKQDRYDLYSKQYNQGNISPVSFPLGTTHGIRMATHPDMFKYVPLDPTFDLVRDIEMHEANFIIVHNSDFTRKWLKWSVLCALTRECIEPEGAKLVCPDMTCLPPNPCHEKFEHIGKCHRQDQSVLSIMLDNLETDLLRQGKKIMVHQSYHHPSRWYRGHDLKRRTTTWGSLSNCTNEGGKTEKNLEKKKTEQTIR
ncbi:hypothetical protein DdX_19125 [Ditylenchus destructor]|uniref:Uncharacterized protein n=1 Tax=Ditylenchus destructor TaxID=166010 RepID=A0AAD4QXF6_9BILA|nr:hypothetical protein DdX_19125 [Ditylenchus destructor]